MDRAVSRLDFRALAGKTVYLDDEPIRGLPDHSYLASCIRQHLLASGSFVRGKEEADYILEVRAGAIGTDRHDLLYGVPSVNIPTVVPVTGFGIPSQIPEIPFVKKTDQRAVAKIALFAYNRTTGQPIWQSGSTPAESDAKAIWIFGAGPFQRGSIYDGTSFAGNELKIPLVDFGKRRVADPVSVASEAFFTESEDNPIEGLAQSESEPSPPQTPPTESSPPDPATVEPAAPAEAALPVVQADHEEGTESSPAKTPLPETPVPETPVPKAPIVESPPDTMSPDGVSAAEVLPQGPPPTAPLPPPADLFRN
jgi:hypothetical protein